MQTGLLVRLGLVAALIVVAVPTDVAVAAPTVTPGTKSGTFLGGVRYRSFFNTGSNEVYLGPVISSPGAANRVEQNLTWLKPGANPITLTWDPVAQTLSTRVGSNPTLTFPSFSPSWPAGQPLNYLSIFVREGNFATVPPSTVELVGVVLDGVALGSFTGNPPNPQAGCVGASNEQCYWSVTGIDLTGGFTLTGTIQLSGPFTPSQEASRVEIQFGYDPPPVVAPGGPYAGTEGAAVPIVGTVTDGDPVTTAWTVSSPSCTVADPAALSTTVTCLDSGTFTLTLTANDGVNDPVAASTTLTIANVAPTVTITAPTPGQVFAAGATVALEATFTDPGTDDTHTCQIAWGDGTASAGTVVGAGTCSASHAYAGGSSPTITVTVTDDDGGVGEAQVSIVITAPPPPPSVTPAPPRAERWRGSWSPLRHPSCSRSPGGRSGRARRHGCACARRRGACRCAKWSRYAAPASTSRSTPDVAAKAASPCVPPAPA